MQEHVAIGMGEQAALVFDLDATQYETPAGNQCVHVETRPNPDLHWNRPCARRIASARGQSAGTVTLILVAWPSTSRGCNCSASMASDSSVMPSPLPLAFA